MMWFLIMMSITISTTFMFLKHPLSMGLALILQTMMVSLMTGLLISTFWFSFILLITMLSGALVLFTYMASIASNEKFQSSISMMTFIMMMILMSGVLILMTDQLNMKSWATIQKTNLNNDQVLSLIKMFNMHNMSITLMMVSYLFMTMIVISYIVNVFEGPLRTKN